MIEYNFSSFYTKSKDGTLLHGNFIKPTDKPIAVLYFIHGLGGHSGRFIKPASLFAEKKIASVGIDLRGNGLSEGKRGYAESIESYIEDIEACIRYGNKLFSNELPKLMMGNSMGGAIALHFALKNKNMFKGVILNAPWLALTKPLGKLKYMALQIFNKVSPTFTFSSKVKPPKLSKQIEKQDTEEVDVLIHKRITARLFMIIDQLGKHLLNNIDCYTPTLILHSPNDPVTDYKSSETLCCKQSLSTKLITLNLSTHDVPFEENNLVTTEVVKFVDKILFTYGQFQN